MYLLLAALLALSPPSEAGSPEGEPAPSVTLLEPGSGVTADMLLPCPGGDAEWTEDVDPGVQPEGDYLMDIAWIPDGTRFVVCNYMSGTVSVMDPLSMEIDTTVALDGYPGGVACTGDYAVVAFPFEDRVDVYSLSDWSLELSFASGEQPWVVEVSGSGDRAFVACDIDDVLEVVDLVGMTRERTVQGFPVWLSSYGWGSESNRFYAKFSPMLPLPGDTTLAVGDGDMTVYVYDVTTGERVDSVTVAESRGLALSGDGSKLAVYCGTNPVHVTLVDLASMTVDAAVTLSGYSTGMTTGMALNQTGSKAFVSTSGNCSHIVRFGSLDFVTFTQTYSPFWIGSSPDHSLAVSGQYRYSVMDLASETMVAQHQGNSQYMGEVSPVEMLSGSYDPTRHEGVYVYDFDGASVSYEGDIISGSPVEGDGTRRAVIAPDGSVAILSNTLSDNVSLLDLGSLQVDTVVYAGDRVQDAAITPDSRWAVICGFGTGSVLVMDLREGEVVADVPTGTRPGVVSITPDGSHAYVGNISSNTVSVVELDGAASSEVAELPCGVIGVSWAACGVSSDVRVSPAGAHCLVAASFDDRVKVIDTATNTVVADLQVGDFPLQLAYSGDGTKALVSNYLGDSYSIIQVDGASSGVLGTWGGVDGPLRVAWDPASERFAVCSYSDRSVLMVDPETGEVTDTHDYSAWGAVLDLEFTPGGNRIVLTGPGSGTDCALHRNGEPVTLSASSVHFDHCPAADVTVAAAPGPDIASVVGWTSQGAGAGSGGAALPLRAGPNPCSGALSIGLALEGPREVRLAVYDLGGRLVSEVVSGPMPGGEHALGWTAPERLPCGVYRLRLDAGGVACSLPFVLAR